MKLWEEIAVGDLPSYYTNSTI